MFGIRPIIVTVTAVAHRSVVLPPSEVDNWPGNPAWTAVDYIGVGTPGSGSTPIVITPMTVQEDVNYNPNLERFRLAFSSGTGIDASNFVPGPNQYKFGTLSPLSGLGNINYVFGLVVT